MTSDYILSTIILAIALAISIGLHEYAHARASNKLGDPTPKLQGRLTPNPLVHLDPLWFLLIFIIHFGRGKPVQINPWYYKNPRVDEFLVAMAGPASNIIMAIFGILFLKLFLWDLNNIWLSSNLFVTFWTQFSFLNIWLALFNLLPIPPLDGRKIVKLFIANAAIRIEYILATNPLLMIVLFVIIWRLWLLNFLSTWSSSFFEILANSINYLF